MTRFDAKAVIGAGYGDEGKGLLTDFLAAETKDTIVVRSNGGAQAGHSVVTDDGLRHVFHHIGSGALAGARTHLSRYFVAHPMLFPAEWSALRERGAELSITSDPRTLITTPFDVAVNQALELARGGSRHGSTGLGFGETIERNRHPQFAVTMWICFAPTSLAGSSASAANGCRRAWLRWGCVGSRPASNARWTIARWARASSTTVSAISSASRCARIAACRAGGACSSRARKASYSTRITGPSRT